MKTISADFNAMTEAGYVCLTLPCSQEAILRLGLRPGDWAWLSDTEIVVGAQLAIDDRYGLVGVPDWDTLAHLDDEGADDLDRIQAELEPLLTRKPPASNDEQRILELLIQLEHAAPPRFRDVSSGFLPLRRAFALRHLGKLRLALLEIKEARQARPDDAIVVFVYLELLGQEDLPSAVPGGPIHRRITGCECPRFSGVYQHPRDAGGTGVRRTVRLDRPASPRRVSSVRSGP